jgi:outer membrane protein assembly factor BamB
VGGGVVVVLRQRCWSQDRAKYRSGDLTLLAFDAATGKRLWTRKDAAVSYPGFASFGYQSKRHVVPVQTTNGTLEGVNLRSGAVLWSRGATMPTTAGGNPAFLDQFGIMGTVGNSLFSSNAGTIITRGGEPRLDAWQLRNGRRAWSADLGAEQVLDFAVHDTALLALRSVALPPVDSTPTHDRRTRIDTLSLNDGSITRALDLGTTAGLSVPTRLVVTGTEFVTGTSLNDGVTIAYDRTSGATRWQRSGLPLVAIGDTVIVKEQQLTGGVVALDASTGVERWRLPGATAAPSGDDAVVVSEVYPYNPERDTTTAVDAVTGAVRWSRSNGPLGFGGTTRGTSLLASPGCPATSAD